MLVFVFYIFFKTNTRTLSLSFLMINFTSLLLGDALLDNNNYSVVQVANSQNFIKDTCTCIVHLKR